MFTNLMGHSFSGKMRFENGLNSICWIRRKLGTKFWFAQLRFPGTPSCILKKDAAHNAHMFPFMRQFEGTSACVPKYDKRKIVNLMIDHHLFRFHVHLGRMAAVRVSSPRLPGTFQKARAFLATTPWPVISIIQKRPNKSSGLLRSTPVFKRFYMVLYVFFIIQQTYWYIKKDWLLFVH